jgi:hypothetical protein
MLKVFGKAIAGALALGLTALPVTAHSAVINVDVSDLVSSYSGTGAAPDTGTYWNVAHTVNSTYSNLIASDGATVTPIDVTFSGWIGEFAWSGSLPINDRFYGPAAGTASVTIAGLTPGMTYELYAYASFWDATYSVGATSESADPTSDTTPWVEGNQYVRLAGLHSDPLGTMTLDVTATAGNSWTNIGALQIVEIPEPTSLALVGLALTAFGIAGRRKKPRSAG